MGEPRIQLNPFRLRLKWFQQATGADPMTSKQEVGNLLTHFRLWLSMGNPDPITVPRQSVIFRVSFSHWLRRRV